MSAELSREQLAIVHAPLIPMSVVACPGSGKTRTAASRLLQIRKSLKNTSTRPTLLSFSNIAVDAFQSSYRALLGAEASYICRSGVTIDTFDGFLVTSIIRPHAHRVMKARSTPFLVNGKEQFLKQFVFPSETHPIDATKILVSLRNQKAVFSYLVHNHRKDLNYESSLKVAKSLAQVGAYTHELGRYWSYRLLEEEPALLKVLAHRHPQILIDEAQDIGPVHQAILEKFASAGSQISLIGDPHQAIYQFADADGAFLTNYGNRPEVKEYALDRNYRSLPSIQILAKELSQQTANETNSVRLEPTSCLKFVSFDNEPNRNMVEEFENAVLEKGLEITNSAVLCRGRQTAEALSTIPSALGQGVTKIFAQAALARDGARDYSTAFKLNVTAFISLLKSPDYSLAAKLNQTSHHEVLTPVRRRIWRFTRNSEHGLPAATLNAKVEWHKQLVKAAKSVLNELSNDYGFSSVDNVGRKLASTKLPSEPLLSVSCSRTNRRPNIRIDTVHQAKGESLDSVMYVATSNKQLRALVAGTGTEDGRIGYVAATRARSMFWLAIPNASSKDLKDKLIALGFSEH